MTYYFERMLKGMALYTDGACIVIDLYEIESFSVMSIAKASLGWFFANVCSAVINFLAVIYFSRKLGASDMGIYFLFFSMLMVFNFLSNGGLSSATIKRISEGKNQYKILAASLLLRTIYLLIIAGAIITFRDQLESYFGANLTIYLLIILFLFEFSDLIREFLLGSSRVAISGFVDFIQQIFKIMFQIILLSYGLFGLIWGLILGVIFSIGIGTVVSRLKLSWPENRDFISLFDFSKYSYGTNLGGLVYDWLGILAIGYFLNSSAAGIYGVCWSLTSAFMLLGQSISSSLFPEISSLNTKNKHDEISSLFANSISYAPFLSLPGFFGALALANYILIILYGVEFESGSKILIILMATRVVQSMQMIIVRSIEGLNRPDIVFRINLGTAVINVISMLILIAVFGPIGAALSAFITISASALFNLHALKLFIPVRVKGELILELVASVFMFIIIFLISRYFEIRSPSELLALIIIGAVVFFSIMALSSDSRKAFRNLCVSIKHKAP